MAKVTDLQNDAESFEDVDELLDLIFPAVPDENPTLAANLLASFIDARIANMGWSVEEFAHRLKIEPAMAHRLLDGTLPPQHITDDLLVRLAEAVEYQPNVLRILLGRDFAPTLTEPEALITEDETDAAFNSFDEEAALHAELEQEMEQLWQEIEHYMDETTEDLLETVEVRYTSQIRTDYRKSKHYDFVIKQIEMILAKHRADARLIEILIQELRELESELDERDHSEKDLHRLDIRRIIHFIRDHAP